MNTAIIYALDFLSSTAYRSPSENAKKFASLANFIIERMKQAGVDKEIIDYFTSICYERYSYLKEE